MRPRPPRGGRGKRPETTRINHRIRVREVRVIDSDGAQLGVMETRKALELAQTRGLDLVEVAAKGVPPVCKILDFGKYKYEQKKKEKEAKKKQTIIVLKEVQFRPRTDTHDVEYKVKNITRFLEDGNKVKVTVRFRGREMAYTTPAYQRLKQISERVAELGVVEQAAKMEGRVLSMVLAPNAKAAAKAKAEPKPEPREGEGKPQ